VNKLLFAIAALTVAAMNSAQAVDITANGGAVTEYVFRGIPLSDGKAAAQGGLDLNAAGFFVGTWASSLDSGAATQSGNGRNGMEVDLYGGYGIALGDFTLGIGATGYFYSDVFDENAYEINLSAGWKFITIDYAIGKYDSTPSQDYTFGSITLEYAGFYGKYGEWGDDFAKMTLSDKAGFFEIGYGSTLTVADKDLFDFSFAIIRSDSGLSNSLDGNGDPQSDTFFIAGATKSFDLFSN
jgi:uncharacterized protein (TIGR02001 family)